MTAALAHLLPDFDPEPLRSAIRGGNASVFAARSSGIDPLEIERIRMEGRIEGRREAERELAQKHQIEIAALEADHHKQTASLTQQLSALAAEAVPLAVSARADEIAAEVSSEVASVLKPIVTARIVDKMVASLANEIQTACRIDAAASISVSGPAELLEKLRENLTGLPGEIDWTESETCDLVLTLDRTRWSTRLEAWAMALKGEIG